jgi:hypothetical protein
MRLTLKEVIRVTAVAYVTSHCVAVDWHEPLGGTDHRNLAEAKVTPARATGIRSGEGS